MQCIEIDGARYQLTEITELPENITALTGGQLDGGRFLRDPVTFTCELRLRKMAQKRYKKLLMSRGISRNQAEVSGYLAQLLGMTYTEAWMKLVICGYV